MKKDSSIQNAIDESLSSIRFNAQDERSVLKNIRYEKAPEPQKKRGFRLDFAFALGMFLILVIPLTVFTLRAPRVVSLSDMDSPILQTSKTVAAQPTAAPTQAPKGILDESAAIHAAKAFYSSVCNTEIFSFEEFTVTCTLSSDNQQYDILMQSIYGNGCFFHLILDASNGTIVQFSDPEEATIPELSALESEKAQAWYQKNGQYIFTWAASTQAEFSRRYEGASLREPKAGEISFAQAAALAQSAAASYDAAFCYPMLFSERASSDGAAHYWVFCFASEIKDSNNEDDEIESNAETASAILPSAVVVLDAATGSIESVRAFDFDSDEDILMMRGLIP